MDNEEIHNAIRSPPPILTEAPDLVENSSSSTSCRKRKSTDDMSKFLKKMEIIGEKRFKVAEEDDHQGFLMMMKSYIKKTPFEKQDSLKLEILTYVNRRVEELNKLLL